jgi:hypothetical protein
LDTKTRSPKECVVCPIEFGLAQNYQKYGGSARSVIGLSKIGKLNILNAISQQLQLSMRCFSAIGQQLPNSLLTRILAASKPIAYH